MTDFGQSDMNLNLLVLPFSRIFLVRGGGYCPPCGEGALGFLLTWLGFLPVKSKEDFIAGIELPTALFGNGYLSTITW